MQPSSINASKSTAICLISIASLYVLYINRGTIKSKLIEIFTKPLKYFQKSSPSVDDSPSSPSFDSHSTTTRSLVETKTTTGVQISTCPNSEFIKNRALIANSFKKSRGDALNNTIVDLKKSNYRKFKSSSDIRIAENLPKHKAF